MRCLIVDSGTANFASVQFALERLGAKVEISADHSKIAAADRLFVPGVSTSAAVLDGLRERGILPILRAWKKPLLGICIGLQILFERSEEGGGQALALLPGVVSKLAATQEHPIPHMGWDSLSVTPSPLLEGIDDSAHVYFAHSYAAPVVSHTVATCTYGAQVFSALVSYGQMHACQFHPERSGPVGARFLDNFLRA